MHTLAIPLTVFVCSLGGTALGICLRRALPEDHLSGDSKEAVKIAMGLVATMTALVLGLLVESAKASYDKQSSELTAMSAKILVLDRALGKYGPETKVARDQLHSAVALMLDEIWSGKQTEESRLEPRSASQEVFFDELQELSPKDDAQRLLKAQALNIAIDVGEMRYLMYEQAANKISLPFLVIMIFWLTALFISFGLLSPVNATVLASFFVAALSVSGAVLLIVEMYTPYAGLIQISSAPLRAALAHLGQ